MRWVLSLPFLLMVTVACSRTPLDELSLPGASSVGGAAGSAGGYSPGGGPGSGGGGTGVGGVSSSGGRLGAGGTGAMGGLLATGGGIGTGGVPGTGGMLGTGGSNPSGSGGRSATGGITAMGGTISTGGRIGSGGSRGGGTGGSIASGGVPAAGGAIGGATNAVGGSSASGGTAGSGGTSSMPITTCNDSFPFLGTWEGNILDFYFEPQEALKLVLSADASGMITGKLTWGDGAPPPAPQGADIPYPPGYWEQQTNMRMAGAPEPWPGFAYTIVRGAGCDTTFRFGVSTSELWQDWCALQTPIDSGSFGWGCTLLGGGGSSDGTSCTIYGQNGESQTYPLWKCEACGSFGINGGVCACDQNGCFANMTATQTFDLTYSVSDGAEILSGPDPDPSCGDCTVRLVRQN